MADGFADRLRRGDVEGLLRRYADVLLAILVVSIVGMMIIPLPTHLLDLLITLNISFSVVLLMVAIYVSDALRVSSFPTILLITTLFRLGLNVSSTRLILLQADAGDVIRAFGEFVVRGNFVVGAIIFLVLTLIQFIVIAKGSERVAEVAARFTLDAMPGKQMAIDADLRAGHITQDEARRRRAALGRESQLYGSMDGAMKFVKGDAIAGIVITVVNIVGGLIVGVTQRDMGAGDAVRTYGLLTIGDGLVSQIPALVISVAAGMIVTRVASEEEGSHLGRDIGGQILAQPKAIAIAAGLLFGLALVPGLPKLPFFVMATITGGVAWQLLRRARAAAPAATGAAKVAAAVAAPPGTRPAPAGDEDLAGATIAAIALEVADDLADACGVDRGKDGALVGAALPALRRSLYQELGVVVPAVRVRRLRGAAAGTWRVRLAEVPVADGTVPADRRLAAEAPERLEPLGVTGEPARVPGTNRPAAWVRPADEPALAAAGVTCLEPAAVLQLALGAVLRRHAHELVGIQETQALLDQLEKTHPALVREVVPKIAPIQLVTEVLRRLVEEGIAIRDLRAILGALADWARAEKDPVILTEYVRTALRRQISFQHARGGALPVWLLEPMVDDAIRGAITKTQTGSFLALEPELSRDILAAFRRAFAERAPGAAPPVVLASMEIRRHVKKLVEIEHPDAVVLSFQELTPSLSLQPVGRIGL
jgi:type III secretion protein V